MKKTNKIIIAGLVLLVILAIVLAAISGMKDYDVKMTVEGDPVSNEEFDYAMSRTIGDVITYYEQIEPGVFGEGFWTKQLGDKKPVEFLVDATTQEVLRLRATYELGIENGDIDTANFDKIEERRLAFNKDRQEAIANGEVVYGKSNLDEDEYLFYELTTLRQAYIENSGKPAFELDKLEIADHYMINKEEYGQEGRHIFYVKVDKDTLTEDLEESLNSLESRMKEGEILSDIITDYPELSQYYEPLKVTDDQLQMLERGLTLVYDTLMSLEEGQNQTSQNSDQGRVLLESYKIGLGPDGSLPKELEERVKGDLQIIKYNEIVTDKMKELEIEQDYENNVKYAETMINNFMVNFGY